MASAIYLISTIDHLNKNIHQFTMLNNKIKNYDIYILFLDELNSINDKNSLFHHLTFITPEEIGLKALDLKRLLFECTGSEFNSKVSPLLVHYLDDYQYPLIIYVDYKIQLAQRHIDFIHALDSPLLFDKMINKIHINIFNDETHEYFYNFYSDSQPILKSDREKFMNMHDLEKEILGDPFMAKDIIRNIKKIICGTGHFPTICAIDKKNDNLDGLKKHISQINYMFSVLNGYQLIILLFYIQLKAVKKFIVKLLRIARINYRMRKAT